jgi:beta-barrel assembly-enhancing protease
MNLKSSNPSSNSIPQNKPGGQRSLRDFGGKLLTLIIILALFGMLMMDGIRYLGSYVPFSLERHMALPYAVELPKPDAVSRSLNALAEKIAIAQGLPHEISVQVHVIDQDAMQAFATLGGHVLIYRGLLKEIKSEDELGAVLAHEVAHLKHRHPTEALGRRVNLALLLSWVSQDLAETIAAPSFGSGLKTPPHYTRDQEMESLMTAGAALAAVYGHIGGAVDLEKTLMRLIAKNPAKPPEAISTHPGLERIGSEMQGLAAERGWKTDGNRRALPPELAPAASAEGLKTPAPIAIPSESAPATPVIPPAK